MSDQENRTGEGVPAHRGGRRFEEWWVERSLAQKIVVGIGLGTLGVGLLALWGLAVMALWNWLMPEIFGLKSLSYWQAWGVTLLSFLLFKGVRFGSEDGRRGDRKRRQHLRRYLREEEGTGVSGT